VLPDPGKAVDDVGVRRLTDLGSATWAISLGIW
jgi:hypothetical protein